MMVLFIQRLRKLKRFNIFLLLLFLSGFSLANLSVKNTPIPGGIAVIDFYTNHASPKAYYGNVPVYIQHIKDQHWQALVGIPLLAKSGEKQLTIQDFSKRKINFNVSGHSYKEQHIALTGKKKKYVNPNLAHMDRIIRERPILTKARKTFSNNNLEHNYFIRPAPGVITGVFGLKRFYNGEARRPHTGIDYAGKIGSLIKASADGKVIIADNFFFNGNAVFIDHGRGLISVYIHMDKILVKSNQTVKQGDTIGTIGQTGRTTGPHLHYGIYLNQTTINPDLLLKNQPI